MEPQDAVRGSGLAPWIPYPRGWDQGAPVFRGASPLAVRLCGGPTGPWSRYHWGRQRVERLGSEPLGPAAPLRTSPTHLKAEVFSRPPGSRPKERDMRLPGFIGMAALGILLLSEPATADCWRLPSGQIVTTHANSTPPIAGAQRVQCPAPGTGGVPPEQARKPQPTGDPCQPYYKKGYCTDYIAQKLGNRPPGDPKTWPVNRDLTKIRQGVAVVFAGVTASGHVAYVERLDRDHQGRPTGLHITEMNFSRESNPTAPPSCLVTKNFGVVTSRTVSLYNSGITGFWPQ